ncbi:hypothetical protein [Vibrio alginolyticus]|uniref:hypothetical protein n=1 Tax=Vibrio alginolyticus TaxID=663 RepID=UPI001BD5C8E3|nr:hypothetical protein [Vibrio alginolyticus]MBS9935824.1 hypothetical protein [Vibrio alginolyticus]
MKKLLLLSLFAASTNAAITFNHQNPNGTDRFRMSDGTSCEQSVDTGKSFYAGVYGEQGSDDRNYDNGYSDAASDEAGVYMGFQITFGGAERIDCKRLYNIALQEKEIQLEQARVEHQLEIELLRAELESARYENKRLQFAE